MSTRRIGTVNGFVLMLEREIASRCASNMASMLYTMHPTSMRFVYLKSPGLLLTFAQEGMDMLEAAKAKHIVAPGINWLIATLHDAEAVSFRFSERSHQLTAQVRLHPCEGRASRLQKRAGNGHPGSS